MIYLSGKYIKLIILMFMMLCLSLNIIVVSAENEKYNIVLKKVDENTNLPLSGASFTVYKDKSCTQKIMDTNITDNTGITNTGAKLSEGEYFVVDKNPSLGYKKNETPYKVQAGKNISRVFTSSATKANFIPKEGEDSMFLIMCSVFALGISVIFFIKLSEILRKN